MAIINPQFPEIVSMANRQPVLVSLTSNLPVAENTFNELRIELTGDPEVGQVVSFSYGDFSIQLTFAEQGETAALTLSTRGILTQEEYAALLVQELIAQTQIFLSFNVSNDESVNGQRIRIAPRGAINLTWQYTTDSPFTISELQAGSDSFGGAPGINLVTEIWDHETQAYNQRIPHQLPVIQSLQPVIFDLQTDFELDYELPPAASIGPGSNLFHQCTRNWTKYRINYAETQGNPPIALPLVQSQNTFYVFQGARGFLSQFANFWQYWETGGRFQTSLLSPRRVSMDQPNWLYWLGRQDNRTLRLKVEHRRRSGATQTLSYGTFTERLGEIVCISTGYRQLGTPDSLMDPITSYSVYLTDAAEEVISERVSYDLTTDCEDWERYFMVGNSLGGFDCIRSTGRWQISSETTTGEGRRAVTAADLAQGRGEDFHYLRQQRTTFSGSVGHVSRQDIVRLQELLMSTSVALIDTAQQIFKPILVSPGTVQLTKDGNDLDALTFQFRYAYEEHAIDDRPTLI